MKVAVIGTGYVGLVTGACLAEQGHTVICVDKEQAKVDQLIRGDIPIYEPGLHEIVETNVGDGRLSFSTDTAGAVAQGDVVFIAVGTPPGPDGNADLSFVREVAEEVGKAVRTYRVVVNKSTVPVGTTDLVAGILAEHTPYRFDVVSNPEFLGEGTAVEDCMHPDRIVIGTSSKHAAEVMTELYSTFEAPVVVTDPRSAEMIKYASNAFLATKISFINEIAGLCDLLGADVQAVSRGMGLDPRIGKAFLKAGIGFGGFCLPKDVRALLHMSERVDHGMLLLQAALDVNLRQRSLLVDRLQAVLGTLEGKTVGILGLAFKPHTDDARDAPALDIVRDVISRGGAVRAFDPKAADNAISLLLGGEDPLEDRSRLLVCASAGEVAEGADALLLVTEWPEFSMIDWEGIPALMKRAVLLDGRNFLDSEKMRKAGFVYSGIGRGTRGSTGLPDLSEQTEQDSDGASHNAKGGSEASATLPGEGQELLRGHNPGLP